MNKLNKNKLWIWLWSTSFVVIVLLGSLQHFIYDWIPCPFFALWAPVNESIWEHTKLAFYPLVVWWIVMYFIFKEDKKLDTGRWFFAMSIAGVLSIIGIILQYWTITVGFAIKGTLPLHLTMMTISVIVAQLVGYHIYKRATSKKCMLLIGVEILAIAVAVFALLTFNPINIPLFISPV